MSKFDWEILRGYNFYTIVNVGRCSSSGTGGMVLAERSREVQLYNQARRMLKKTNPYKKDIEEIYYHSSDSHEYGIVYSLCDMLRQQIEEALTRTNEGITDAADLQICFYAIGRSLSKYADAYPSSAAFKLKMRETFIKWMEKIIDVYRITDQAIPESLYRSEGERDMLISMIKALHKRNGVTKKELRDILGIHPRSIMKNLSRLDPEMSETNPENVNHLPYTLGGQTVRVKVQSRKKDNKREWTYRTENTLHPIVLLENIMQAGTLLKGMEKLYYDEENEVSTGIAIDIWSQLSDYGKERIKRYYFAEDPGFLEILEDDHAVTFHTEREIMRNERMSPEERIVFYLKASSRRCKWIVLDLEEEGLGTVEIENASLDMTEDCRIQVRSPDRRWDLIVDKKQIIDLE